MHSTLMSVYCLRRFDYCDMFCANSYGCQTCLDTLLYLTKMIIIMWWIIWHMLKSYSTYVYT